MKNFMPTLGVGLRKIIHRQFPTLTVKENYTSKRCNKCFKDMVKHKNIHRLFVCGDCVKSNVTSENVSLENKRIVFRSRDKNAATNILNVAKYYFWYKQRHPYFDFRSSCYQVTVS